MTGTHALGIDVGTSGIRTALLAPDGEVCCETAARMDQFGSNLRSPAIWEKTLAAALSQLLDTINPSLIGAVAVDGTSGTVLALDAADQPIGDALMYNDSVDDPAIAERISKVAPRESAAHGVSSGLSRAISLQARPEVARILHQADWVAEQIADAPTGSDESNALKSGYDPVARCWPDWIANTGMNPNLLPAVLPAGQISGATSGRYGLPLGAQIIAGVTDGCASFLATGADKPGDGVTALGTTLTIKLLSNAPVFAPEFGIYSHRIGDRWLAGGASNTGGGVLAQFFDADAIAALSSQIDPSVPSGLNYYPLPRPGERFPTCDPGLQPVLDPRPEDDVLFLQGMLEAMARIETAGYAKLSELGAPALTRLRTVGGGAANAAWTRLRLETLNVSAAPAHSTSAAAGVARLALSALSK